MSSSSPLMHRFLMEKADWYETCLARRAEALGYGYIRPTLVSFIKVMDTTGPSRIAVLAERLGVTRRRVSQIAAEGVAAGLFEFVEDPSDKRVLLVQLSERGELMVDAAVASMKHIEAELARRIGRAHFEALRDVLAMDWGPARVEEGAHTPAASASQEADSLLAAVSRPSGRRR